MRSPRLWSLLLLGALLIGCGDTAASSDVDAAADLTDVSDVLDTSDVSDLEDMEDMGRMCPHGEFRGVCKPEPPRGTPGGMCPGGERVGHEHFAGGICLPEPPRTTLEEPCPSGSWTEVAGMKGPGICDPLPPAFQDWTCPAGWDAMPGFTDAVGAENTPDDMQPYMACRPPVSAKSCVPGTRAAADSDLCVPHGATCPTQTWADETSLRARAPGYTGTIWYVAANAAPMGVGTRAAPFGTLAEALTAASGDDVIALSAGSYETPPQEVDAHIAILGACVSGTLLTDQSAAPADIALTLRQNAQVLVRDLSFEGTRNGIWVDRAQFTNQLVDVRIDGASEFGIRISAANVPTTLQGVVVSNSGSGVRALSSSIEVTDSVIESFATVGVFAQGVGAVVTTDRTVVRDPSGDLSDPSVGVGVRILGDATLTMRSSVLRDNGAAVLVEQANLTLQDVWIEGHERPGEDTSRAVETLGSTVTMHRVQVRDTLGSAIKMDGGSALLEDVVVADNTANSSLLDLNPETSLWAVDVDATLRRVVVERCQGLCLLFQRCTVTAEDVVGRDSEYLGELEGARSGGVAMFTIGTVAVVTRMRLERGARQMLSISQPVTHVEITELDVRDCQLVLNNTGNTPCVAIKTALDGHLVVRRGRVTDPRGTAVESGGRALVDLSDMILRDSPHPTGEIADPYDYTYGYDPAGLVTSPMFSPGGEASAGTLIAERVVIDGFSHRGVVASGTPQDDMAYRSTMALTDVVIRNIGPAAEFYDSEAIYAGAEVKWGILTIERGLIEGIPTSALFVHDEGLVGVVDLDVRHIYALPAEGTGEGRGLLIDNASGVMDRVRVENTASHAMLLSESSLTVTDFILINNNGRGLTSQSGSELDGQRIWLDNNTGIGLYVNVQGNMTLADIAVTRTAALPCVACDVPEQGFGVGLYEGAQLEVDRFVLAKNQVVGMVVNGGALSAREGVITKHLIAVNIGVEDFDVAAAFDNVLSIGNLVDIDTRGLDVPALLEDLDID